MSATGPVGAIHKALVVRCSVEQAFQTWTGRIDEWWPKDHSRSRDAATTIVLERRVGGRLYERTPDGVEYSWGEVLAWEPPHHLAYHWYLGSSAAQPTRVDIWFVPADGGTRVEVLHQGPALIGERWPSTSRVFDAAWDAVLRAFHTARYEEAEPEGA